MLPVLERAEVAQVGVAKWPLLAHALEGDIGRDAPEMEHARRRRHDYLKSLAQLLAEHGRKSGADMKKLLDPNSASHCKSKQVIISDSDDE